QVYPDMDHERVYDSDRKKMIKWFALLKKHAIPLVLSEPLEDEAAQGDSAQGEPGQG
ncbi:MAG: hypothetical protein ACKOD1_07375, partial [Sphingomonadales bacterium]